MIYSTASISCDVSGTTSAFCHAKETIFVKGTLAPKDLNWMDVPMATMSPNSDSTNAIGTFEGSAGWYIFANPSIAICSFLILLYFVYFALLRFCYVSSLSI
jgi:hypothetical protein